MTDQAKADYAALILRLSMGALFLAHAGLKVFVFTPAGTAAYFAGLGLPEIFAYLTIAAEAGAGVALILGVFTRLVSIAALPILIGATIVHAPNGWLFSAENGGWEFPAFWTATLLVQALLGDGAYALSRFFRADAQATSAKAVAA